MPSLNKSDFFKKYNISDESFCNIDITWEELNEIYNDYSLQRDDFDPIAQLVISKLHKIKNIHSIKYRIKDAEHLIEKIIRKKIDNAPGSQGINLENYKERITDLIGIRIISLFKEDWISILKYVIETFDLISSPKAYVREGDSEDYLRDYKENNCEIRIHKFGYRSVHYLIKIPLFKNHYIAEIQVRTIFEEGWSEIDHKFKYPYIKNNIALSKFLTVLNRFAGGADEMGSFINYLYKEMTDYQKEAENYHKTIGDLKDKISGLEVNDEAKSEIAKKIEEISRALIKTTRAHHPGMLSVVQPFPAEFSSLVDWKNPEIKYKNGVAGNDIAF